MRTKEQALKTPIRGDVWKTKILWRLVKGKQHGLLGVWTTGGGRVDTFEALSQQQFARWANNAEYLGMVKG